MARVEYNKLVRDNIKDKLLAKEVPHTIVAIQNSEVFRELLLQKTREELEEFLAATTK